jgi:hypothetical protein
VRDDRPWGDAISPAVRFAYTPDRKGQHLQAHSREFRDTLQAHAKKRRTWIASNKTFVVLPGRDQHRKKHRVENQVFANKGFVERFS